MAPSHSRVYRSSVRAAWARAGHQPVALGHVALALADAWSFTGRSDQARLDLLEEAVDGLGALDVGLRARLLARLAAELYYVPRAARRRARLSNEAVRLTRSQDDPVALAAALHARNYATW